MIDELSEDKISTALRFLTSLWKAGTSNNGLKQFLDNMSPEDTALLDAMAELDNELGAPPFVDSDGDLPA